MIYMNRMYAKNPQETNAPPWAQYQYHDMIGIVDVMFVYMICIVATYYGDLIGIVDVIHVCVICIIAANYDNMIGIVDCINL